MAQGQIGAQPGRLLTELLLDILPDLPDLAAAAASFRPLSQNLNGPLENSSAEKNQPD